MPKRPGVIVISDARYIVETPFYSTITIIPEGMTASSWQPSCGRLSVSSPPAGASVSTTFALEGSVEKPSDTDLKIARIDAWIDGVQIGSTTRVHSSPRDLQSEFVLSIQDAPAGAHTLLLLAYFQNNSLAATATIPLDFLPNTPHRSLLPGYLGTIDLPAESDLLSLPVTVQGWVVIPGSDIRDRRRFR